MEYVGTSIHFRRKGSLEKIRKAAALADVSVSAFITQAAEEKAEKTLKKGGKS